MISAFEDFNGATEENRKKQLKAREEEESRRLRAEAERLNKEKLLNQQIALQKKQDEEKELENARNPEKRHRDCWTRI